MAAETCVDNCPHRKKHYEVISRLILGINSPEESIWTCPHNEKIDNFYINLITNRPSRLDNAHIDYLYNIYGFNTIKVSGRDEPDFVVLEYLLYFLVKEPYRDVLRLEIMWMLQERKHQDLPSF